jgi:hypothetical protein
MTDEFEDVPMVHEYRIIHFQRYDMSPNIGGTAH